MAIKITDVVPEKSSVKVIDVGPKEGGITGSITISKSGQVTNVSRGGSANKLSSEQARKAAEEARRRDLQRQKKLQEQERKRQEAERKRLEQQREQSQQKAFEGTIAGQLGNIGGVDRGGLGKPISKYSTDVKTGDRLLITETRGGVGSGVLVRDVFNLNTGSIVSNLFSPGLAGGGVSNVYRSSGNINITPKDNIKVSDLKYPGLFSNKGNQLINLPNNIKNNNRNIPGMTMMDYGSKLTGNYKIYTEPTIEERQIDTFKDRETGRTIPITGTFLIEPPTGSKGGIVKETRIYPSSVTPSGNVFKIEGYEDITVGKELVASTEKRNIAIANVKDVVIGGFSSVKSNVKDVVIGGFSSVKSNVREIESDITTTIRSGFSEEQSKKQRQNVIESTELLSKRSKESTQFLIESGVPKPIAQLGGAISQAGIYAGGLISGAAGSTAEKTIANPIIYPTKLAAISAVSAGFGFGVAGGSALASSIGPAVGVGAKIVGGGAGLILGAGFVGAKATEFKSAQTVFEKGGVLGQAGLETAAGIGGFKTGQRLFSQTRGYLSTRGREFLDITQGDYPTAPASKQVKMFKQNVISQLDKDPGAFHTTPKIFYKNGQIVPQAGTSELPGLYGSTQISRTFSRITGSSDSPKLFPNLKDLFAVDTGKPGVAYIVPKEFRYSPAVRTPSIIDGQKFGYSFLKPSKSGVADIPLIKSEIEAIFRPDAGSYAFQSGSYYTTIKGVRVPIDVFKFDTSSTVVTSTTSPVVNLIGGRSGGFSSYSAVPSSAIFSPSLGISSVISSLSTSSKSYISPSSYSVNRSYSPSSSFAISLRGFGSSAFGSSRSSSSVSIPSISSSLSYGSSTGGGSSSRSSLIPQRPTPPGLILPKFPRFKQKSQPKAQLFSQPDRYQVSLTGSILGIRGTGLAPGGLSVRGILDGKSKRKKKFSIL